MFLIEIVYMNVYIWQGLSNCTLKMGQVLCLLYLNKVGLKKKTNYAFPFYHRHSVLQEYAHGGNQNGNSLTVWNLV